MVTRILALFVLVAGVVFVAVSYYKLRNKTRFVMWPGAAELSKEVTGRIEGYEQRITKSGGDLYLWVRAAREITFADGHHELENINLTIYSSGPKEKPDQITANRAIYDQKNKLISFLGNVKVETKDALKVDTEAILYNQDTEVAQSDVAVSFSRENVSGHSVGAIVESKSKKLELKKDVEITVAPEAPKNPTEQPTKLSATRSRPVTIRAAHAVFEQNDMRLSFSGGVTAEQERDIMSGDTMNAILNQQKRLEKVEVRGNSYLRTMNPGRAAELHSVDMDFFLDADQRLKSALARTDPRGRSLDADSEMQLTGKDLVEAIFQAQGQESLLQSVRSQGRSIVNLSAPKSRANDPRAKNKRITADGIKLDWRASGKDLQKAEAVGNAELYVEPAVPNDKAERQTVTGSRFDCDFFEADNLARNCVVSGPAKAVIDPLQKNEKRGIRTITSDKMSTTFVRETQDPERIEAQGNAKFNELDRNGTAGTVIYTSADETVRMRGGEPTVWDSRARSKAIELDSDLKNGISYSRGKTSTTYYSQEQTNGATPFTKVKSPVYVVSDRGEFHHNEGVATYSGDARAWQDDNFVRSDKLTIYVNEKRMTGNGHVQSALYNAKRREKGVSTTVPVFATAESMRYSDADRLLHYETNVDIRQGPDRVTGGVADVYLTKDTNEVDKTITERNVVMTQPGRKGTGDWMQYTAVDEVAVLKGNPARVEDVEQGTLEGGRLTVNMREGRVVADDTRGPQSGGRVRSTHKISKPKDGQPGQNP
ncbi:MAG TPA: LPS export ABC transporter periplasmic protein LptC [Pyrinomonadaceae bacterium]|nr:LPS export ABC transporter periplasmic protein LptC [Pyrinomonadaceae bacterium]